MVLFGSETRNMDVFFFGPQSYDLKVLEKLYVVITNASINVEH